MKNVFRVTIPQKDANGNFRFTNFECDAISVEDLAQRLTDGWVVPGEKLFTRRRADGDGFGFDVVGREPYALSRHGVVSIELPHGELFETEAG